MVLSTKMFYSNITRSGCDTLGSPLVDLLQRDDEDPPEAGKKILCTHPFQV